MGDLMFYVGMPLSVEIAKNRSCVTTRLIGWEKDAYIIMRYPYLNEKPVNLKSKTNCIVRFVKDGIAYGFTSEVLSLQFHPAPLIFLKYPANIESMPFRGSKRFKTIISAKLKVLQKDKPILADATIIDISDSGCGINIPSDKNTGFETGNRCYLTFMIMDKGVEVDCIIKNFNEIKGNYVVGLEFVNVSPSNKEVISFYLAMLKNASK